MPTVSSKRHVHSRTPGHLSSGSAQVLGGEDRGYGRRHCQELGGRPASARAARRGVWPHQRRHIGPEDHLIGPYVYSNEAPPLVCGTTKARASSNPPGGWVGSHNMTAALRDDGSHWQPPGGFRKSPSRRVLENDGHLLGGYVWPSSAPAPPDPFTRRRAYDEPPPNLIGGSLRMNNAPSCTSLHSKAGREDHLIGGVFRAASCPGTPRRYGRGSGEFSNKAASIAAPSA